MHLTIHARVYKEKSKHWDDIQGYDLEQNNFNLSCIFLDFSPNVIILIFLGWNYFTKKCLQEKCDLNHKI